MREWTIPVAFGLMSGLAGWLLWFKCLVPAIIHDLPVVEVSQFLPTSGSTNK